MQYDESRDKTEQENEYVQVDQKIVNATFNGFISGMVPNLFNEKMQARWKNEISLIASHIDFSMMELAKVKGVFSYGKSSYKVLEN